MEASKDGRATQRPADALDAGDFSKRENAIWPRSKRFIKVGPRARAWKHDSIWKRGLGVDWSALVYHEPQQNALSSPEHSNLNDDMDYSYSDAIEHGFHHDGLWLGIIDHLACLGEWHIMVHRDPAQFFSRLSKQ